MRYRLIGIDLDGTLLDRHSKVSRENLAALAAARAAGAMIVPCTGRAWSESRMLLEGVAGLERGVFVGGAVVTELATGRSLDLAVIEPHLARELVDSLYDLPEAVLVFQDAALAGRDYLITGRGQLSANTRWWLKLTNASPLFKKKLTLEDLHHSLRVGIVGPAARMAVVVPELRQRFGERILMHAFQALEMPQGGQVVHVLEIFARGVDKWRGLSWIAAQAGIEAADIAVIGDQVNDVAMIEAAGCGIAMGNAIDAVKAKARHVTLGNNESGVAHAIGRLLDGTWD